MPDTIVSCVSGCSALSKRRILVVQPMQSLLQLFLVGAVGRVHRHVDRGLRELDLRQSHRMLACVDSVSFVCVFRSFATQPMSPAWSRGISMRSLPWRDGQVIELLGALRVAL